LISEVLTLVITPISKEATIMISVTDAIEKIQLNTGLLQPVKLSLKDAAGTFLQAAVFQILTRLQWMVTPFVTTIYREQKN